MMTAEQFYDKGTCDVHEGLHGVYPNGCVNWRPDAAAQLAEKEREIARLLPQRNKWAMLCQHFGVPEKETCVATITDKFVAAEQRLQEAQAEIELLRHNRNEALKDEDDTD